jgi:hypothetical protein
VGNSMAAPVPERSLLVTDVPGAALAAKQPPSPPLQVLCPPSPELLPRGGQRPRRDRRQQPDLQRWDAAEPEQCDPGRNPYQIQYATAINANGQIVANANDTTTTKPMPCC